MADDVEAWLQRTLAEAPDLTAAQRQRVVRLLTPATDAPETPSSPT